MEEEDSDNSEYHSDTLLSDQEEQAREIPPDTVADPDMPADHLTPTQVETTARMEVDSALDELLIYMNEDDPDYRSGLDTLTPLSDKLASLQEKVLPRISKIAEDAARNQQRQEWVAYKTKVKRDIAKYFKILEKKDVQNEKRLLEENISGLGSRMTGAIETVAAQLTGLEGKQGYQIPRDLYLQFKAVLDPVRKQLEEEIPRLYTELCSKDPGAAFTVEEQRTTLENQIRGILLAVQTRLDNLPREEVSFSQPQSSSTPNSSINPGSGNDSLTSSVRSGARTSYKKIVEQIPRFNGDPIRYPQWKTEMKEDILPGNSEPHCIRVLADHCPITDLGDVPDRTLEEAWKILDNFYANPNVVSSHVIPAFLDMTVLPGNSKQEQLVHLYKRLEKMHGTLAAVGKADSLVNSESALTKARKLMPNKYLEEFAYEENRALQEKNVDFLPDKEVFKLLMDYLKTKHRMFIGVDLVSPTCGVGPLPNATQFAPKPVQQTRTGDSGGSRSNGGKAGKGGKGGPSTHHLSGGGGGGGGGNSGRSGAGGSGLGTGGGSNPFTPPKPTDQEMRAIRAEWKKLGPCPHCKEEGHMFYYKREKTWRPSHQLSNCPQWMQLGKDDRANYIVTNKFCYKCTSRNHHQLQCDKIHATWKCRAKNSAGVQCSEFHSHHLHGTSVVLHLLQSYNIGRENWVPGPGDVLDDEEFMLLMRQDVMLPVVGHTFSGPNGDVPATILLDSGSNTTVVTNKLARQLGLKGRTVTQEVQVVGRDPEPMQITFYPFTFDTFKGPKRMILLGMDKISSTPGNFSVDAAYDCFPWCEPGSLEKPAGDIDMILGTDNCSLLPTGGEGQSLAGNLRVMNIPFSPGRVLLGSDSRISFTNPVVNREVFHIMKASRSSFNSFGGSAQEHEMEVTPYSLPARCHTCTSCQFCSLQEPGETVKKVKQVNVDQPDSNLIPVTSKLTPREEEIAAFILYLLGLSYSFTKATIKALPMTIFILLFILSVFDVRQLNNVKIGLSIPTVDSHAGHHTTLPPEAGGVQPEVSVDLDAPPDVPELRQDKPDTVGAQAGCDIQVPDEPGGEVTRTPPPWDSGASPLSPSLGPTCHTPPQGSKYVRHTPISHALHLVTVPDDSAPASVSGYQSPGTPPPPSVGLPSTMVWSSIRCRGGKVGSVRPDIFKSSY